MTEIPSIASAGTLISVNELKRLMVTIADSNMEIGMRYRLIGEMWEQNYMTIMKVTEFGLLLNDLVKNRLIVIRDLSQIMQFELDSPFHSFRPNFHYNVNPSRD
jgi:hypothetical protein